MFTEVTHACGCTETLDLEPQGRWSVEEQLEYQAARECRDCWAAFNRGYVVPELSAQGVTTKQLRLAEVSRSLFLKAVFNTRDPRFWINNSPDMIQYINRRTGQSNCLPHPGKDGAPPTISAPGVVPQDTGHRPARGVRPEDYRQRYMAELP